MANNKDFKVKNGLVAGGTIESTTGGIKFPDGTTQTTASSGGGNVSNTGTPANNQIAVWTDATTIEGDSELTWDGSQLATTGTASFISGGVQINSDNGGLVNAQRVIAPFIISDNRTSLYSSRGLTLASGRGIHFNGTANWWETPDLVLERDAANTLAQRNGTNSQVFNIYNTYTDASNYERASLKWNSNTFEFASESAGTGTTRNFNFTGGNVGIGDDSPDVALSIATDDNTNTGPDKAIRLGHSSDTARSAVLTKSRDFGANKAELKLEISKGVNGSPLTFYSNVNDETMRLSENGKLGIGTTSPDAKLHVTEDSTATYLATFEGDLGTNNNRALKLRTPDTDSGSEPFTWYTNNAVAWQIDATEAMRINSAGNVGIGTAAPDVELHVAGGLRVGESSDFDSGTDVNQTASIMLPEHGVIGFDTGQFIRTLISKDSSGHINVGQSGTAIISQVNLLPGTSGSVRVESDNNSALMINNNGSGSARLQYQIAGSGKYGVGVQVNGNYTIYDIVNVTTPFTVEDGCATDSLRIQANGEVTTVGNFVAHTVEATTGGVKFPDGTTQTSAAAYYYSATSTDTTTNHNASSTPTVVDFNSQLLNQGSFTESGGRITVPVAGVYRIYGQVTFTRGGGEQRMSLQLQIFKNATAESGTGRGSYIRGIGGIDDATAYIEDFVNCAASDILDIRAFRDGVAGTSILNANTSRLLIQRIG